jgi:hypothetical protein
MVEIDTGVMSGSSRKNAITRGSGSRLGRCPVPTVYDLTLEQLTDRLVSWGEPAFRAKQVRTQLWKRAVT